MADEKKAAPSTRTYLLFGSNDDVNWVKLGEKISGSAEQALRFAQASDKAGYKFHAACTDRGWHSGEAEIVQPPPIVRFKPITPGQRSIEEVIAEAEDEGILEATTPPAEERRTTI